MIKRIVFHKSGKPRGWLRKLLITKEKTARPIFHRIVHKRNGTVRLSFVPFIAVAGVLTENCPRVPVLTLNGPHRDLPVAVAQPQSLKEWLTRRWPTLTPIPVFFEPMDSPRITIVTDGIGTAQLFGGVGTALIMGALWAERSKAHLRIVTREEPPQSTALFRLLKANGLSFSGQVDFRHCPLTGERELPVGDQDLFLSTSWWTTRGLLGSVGANKIVYLLQEDERMFYPHGDDRLECQNTLAAPLRKIVVNSSLLWEHLTTGCEAIEGLLDRGVYFEPAFVTHVDSVLEKNVPSDRKRLFFYARPNNFRNLFATGVSALGEAVLTRALDPAKWEVHFVGNYLPEIEFPGGLRTVHHAPLPWDEYKALMATMDAGFVLMYTPHPSYPPFDLAAIGIPVLTNRFGLKRDLSAYSKNIICVDPTTQALAQGLGWLTELAEDPQTRQAYMDDDRILRDWGAALKPVIDELDALLPGRA